MPLVDQIRELSDRTQADLMKAQEYFDSTKAIWRLMQELAAQGETADFPLLHTGTILTATDLARRAEDYVSSYLSDSVFQHHVSRFEDFLFERLRLWLSAHPAGIPNKDKKPVNLAMVIEAADKDAIQGFVIDRELNALKYERPMSWFRYLNDRVHPQLERDRPDHAGRVPETDLNRPGARRRGCGALSSSSRARASWKRPRRQSRRLRAAKTKGPSDWWRLRRPGPRRATRREPGRTWLRPPRPLRSSRHFRTRSKNRPPIARTAPSAPWKRPSSTWRIPGCAGDGHCPWPSESQGRDPGRVRGVPGPSGRPPRGIEDDGQHSGCQLQGRGFRRIALARARSGRRDAAHEWAARLGTPQERALALLGVVEGIFAQRRGE